MNNILNAIIDSKQAEIALLKKQAKELESLALAQGRPRPFLDQLQKNIDQNGIALICEFKRQSPSAGIICEYANPAQIARAYQKGGASALSILTDTPYFGGSEADLKTARAASTLPVLRKDFMLEEIQIYQSRAMGADAILLIMAALSDETARTLCDCARKLGMAVLIEVHDQDELSRALTLPSPLIGINNRNLRTFQTSLEVCEELSPHVPNDRILVAESGIKTASDINRLCHSGIHAFLIGQSLMNADSPEKLLQDFSRSRT